MQFPTMARRVLQTALAALLLGACASSELAPPPPAPALPEEVAIWENGPPDPRPAPAAESLTAQDNGWRQISIIKNVSNPTVTIIRPPAGRANGASMIVLPGGAFGVLAWDVEGTEVGQFLADRGITAFVLKYRVRDPNAEIAAQLQQARSLADMFRIIAPARIAAADDAMQAVRFVRANAARYGLDASRVGMMGFSAGAITTMRVVHEADASAAPNIAAPIYGVMLEEGAPAQTPPLFLALARDDGLFTVDQVEALNQTWENAGAPSQVHILESGGHGFGLGRPGTDSARFPALFETWLRERGFITDAG